MILYSVNLSSECPLTLAGTQPDLGFRGQECYFFEGMLRVKVSRDCCGRGTLGTRFGGYGAYLFSNWKATTNLDAKIISRY